MKPLIIGVSGKGGVGKTTVSALMLKALLEIKGKNDTTLVIDADPNTCLPYLIGVDRFTTVSSMIDAYHGSTININDFKNKFLSILMENEMDGFDFIALGHKDGPGCYCLPNYHLRNSVESFILKDRADYRYILMDTEAGVEHVSRRTSIWVDHLVIVVDGSKMSLDTVENIISIRERVSSKDTAGTKKYYVLGNRIDKPVIEERISSFCRDNVNYIGSLASDDEIASLNFEGKQLLDNIENSHPAVKQLQVFLKGLMQDE